jgi:hypothetical protein
MIEVNKTYDLLPNIDQQAYIEYAKRAIRMILRAHGIIEIRAYRSLLGLPNVRLTLMWQTLADWSKIFGTAYFDKLCTGNSRLLGDPEARKRCVKVKRQKRHPSIEK